MIAVGRMQGMSAAAADEPDPHSVDDRHTIQPHEPEEPKTKPYDEVASRGTEATDITIEYRWIMLEASKRVKHWEECRSRLLRHEWPPSHNNALVADEPEADGAWVCGKILNSFVSRGGCPEISPKVHDVISITNTYSNACVTTA